MAGSFWSGLATLPPTTETEAARRLEGLLKRLTEAGITVTGLQPIAFSQGAAHCSDLPDLYRRLRSGGPDTFPRFGLLQFSRSNNKPGPQLESDS